MNTNWLFFLTLENLNSIQYNFIHFLPGTPIFMHKPKNNVPKIRLLFFNPLDYSHNPGLIHDL